MAGHRYWRLRGIASFPGQDTNPMWVCEFGWNDASGTSLGTPTFTSSSSIESGTILTANAGDAYAHSGPAVGWQGTGDFADQWIAADYGSAVLPHQVQFRDVASSGSYWLGTQVAIEWSDDATTWTQSQIIEPGSIPGDQPYVYRVEDPGHRYWRLKGVTPVSGHSADGMGMNSLDWVDADGVTLGTPTYSASATDAGWSLAQVDDANSGSVGWYSGSTSVFAGAWVAADFGAIVQPKFVKFCSLNTFPWTTGREIDVEWSDDGSTWTEITHLRGLGAQKDGEVRQWRVGYEPEFLVPHRAWRVKSDTVGNGGRGCTVASEIELMPDRFGSSLTYGLTPYALFCSSEGFGGRANAFDLDKGTIWHASCGTGGNDFICWDSGASTGDWLAVGAFSWRARDDGSYADQDSIKTGGLEWTDDDPSGTPTWTRLYAIVAETGWSAAERRAPEAYVAPTNDVDGHRYWRIYQYRNQGSQTGIAELEMARTPGGDNVCRTYQGGSSDASGHYSGYDAFKGFDGVLNNGSNEWGVSGGGNSEQWLMWDFGSGAAYTINEFRIAPMTDNGATPRIFEVQSSDDNSTWTREWFGVYDGTYTYGSLHNFARPDPDDGSGAHRFIGIMNTKSALEKYYGGGAGSSLDLVCRELEMAATPGGTNLMTGGSPHWYPTSDPPSTWNDGNYASEAYNGAVGTKRATMFYDFGTPTTITEVRYTRGDSSNTNYGRSPAEGWLVYSDDGMSWQILAAYTDVTYVAPGPGTTDTGFIDFVFSSIASSVGSAVGTSTASGVYIAAGTAEGHASGTSAVDGREASLGTIQGTGNSIARGIATGIADPFRRAVGSAAGTSVVTGRGAAVGTISGVGLAEATSTGDSGSAATGIISAIGTTDATSFADAFGTGRLESTGSADGTSTADAGGSYVPTRTVAHAAGVGAANGRFTAIRVFAGNAAGRGEVLGFMAGVRGMVGASVGTGSSNAITDQNRPFVGTSAATSSALGVGTGVKSAVGAADGTSDADAGGGYQPLDMVGIAAGGSTALAQATVIRVTVGAANATSGADGRSNSLAPAVGAVTSTSTSVGASRELHLMRGSVSGASAGDGHSVALGISVGRTAGISLATAFGVRVGHFAPGERIVVVPPRPKVVQVDPSPPSSRVVVVAPRDKVVVVQPSSRVVSAA